MMADMNVKLTMKAYVIVILYNNTISLHLRVDASVRIFY